MELLRNPFLAVLLLAPALPAQSPVLVKDLNPFAAHSNFEVQMVDVGGTLYLTGYDLSTGWELWKTDGTLGGTELVKDLTPGPESTYISKLISFPDSLYFFAHQLGRGFALWKSDGTPAGTFILREFPGLESPLDPLSSGSLLFFWPKDDATGIEPWRSDGTPEGTFLLKDLNPGPARSFVDHPLEHRGAVYFKADDGTHGRRFWRSRGSPEDTVMVEDLVPGLDASYSLTKWDDLLYFFAPDGRLWRSDGTPEGTSFRGDITTVGLEGSGEFIAELNGLYLFKIYQSGIGEVFWKSDGTADGTSLLKEVWPADPRLFRGMLYFTGYGGGEFNIWRTDGTPAGTVRITPEEVSFGSVVSFDGGFYYVAETTYDFGSELFRTDDTPEGTTLVKDLFPGRTGSFPDQLTMSGGKLFFTASDPRGTALFRSDGTEEGTAVLKDLFPGPDDANPRWFTELNGAVLFTADDGLHGEELWRSDGTAEGTWLVKDLFPDPDPSNTFEFTKFKSRLYFMDRGSLWVTDGSPEGTQLVNGRRDQSNWPLVGLTAAGGKLFFISLSGVGGKNLYQSDGTETGTTLVKDLSAAGWSASPATSSYLDLEGKLLFAAYRRGGSGLWRSDGTEQGTVLIREFGGVGDLAELRGRALFLAGGAGATELWTSDGTPEGTVKVKPVPGGILRKAGDLVYLLETGRREGYSLWRSDGTEEGTIPLREGFVVTNPAGLEFAEAQGRFFFNANDGVHGNELWRSDGTPEGTSMVLDLTPGPADSLIAFGKGSGDLLFFSAGPYPYLPPGTIPEGLENAGDLWRTDGTPEGTLRIAVMPHGGNLRGYTIVRFGDQLLFSARDWPHGWELWAFPLTERPPLRGDANGDGRRDLSDAIAILGCLFLGHGCPPVECRIDVNSDARGDVSDAISLLGFLFLGGAAPEPCR